MNKNKLNHRLYSVEECFNAAKTCKSIKEFHDRFYSFYMSSRYHGIMSDFTWFTTTPRVVKIKYTEEVCLEAAKKYKYLKDFRTYSSSEYNKSRKKGWLKNYTWLVREI